MIARCKQILGEDVDERIDYLDNRLMDLMKPKIFDSTKTGSTDIEFELNYEKFCSGLREYAPNIKELTVNEVYSLVDYIKEKNKIASDALRHK